jgi:putative transposase
MPRRTQIHLDKVPLHIVQRDHNREPCFFTEEDYQAYLYWLGEALQKERCRLHAYVLVTNHVHLLITPDPGPAGQFGFFVPTFTVDGTWAKTGSANLRSIRTSP